MFQYSYMFYFDQASEIKQLPIKAYLDQQVMPLLLQALTKVSKEKPEDPIDFIAKYMLANNPEKNWVLKYCISV